MSNLPLTDELLTIPHFRNLSDHRPICVTFKSENQAMEALIPDRTVASDLCQEVIQGILKTPTDLNERRDELGRNGRPTVKPTAISEVWQRRINNVRLKTEGDPVEEEKKKEKLRKALEQIAEDRFSSAASQAFKNLRRLTRYHEF